MTATQDLIDAARTVIDRLFLTEGATDDTKTLYNTTVLLEKYVGIMDKATDTMSLASAEINSLREQVNRSRQGAALLALEKSDEQIEYLLKVIKAMEKFVRLGLLDTATILATSVFANEEYKCRKTKIV